MQILPRRLAAPVEKWYNLHAALLATGRRWMGWLSLSDFLCLSRPASFVTTYANGSISARRAV